MTALTYPERVEQTYVLAMAMLREEVDVDPRAVADFLDHALANARFEHRRDKAKAATS